MSWFKRKKEGITTTTSEKKETPEGFWVRCSNCKTMYTSDDLIKQRKPWRDVLDRHVNTSTHTWRSSSPRT